jgi:bifunctional UDP-N-acetylglucosamine pyrophosphorylase/glucosamine-1-phosphate N-acetyltransferase
MNDTSTNKDIIVLAAGKGSRMGSDLPKVLVPFNNQTMIDHVLEQVYQTGEQQPLIVVGHQSTAVENHCGSNCRYVLQEEQKGTGHAVLVTEDYLKDNVKHVLVVYGDQPLVTSESMKKMFLPLSVGVKLVLATALIENDDLFTRHFYNYGRIIRDDKGAIIKIVEAKDATKEERKVREVNVGFMAFDKVWGFNNLHSLTTDNAQGEYYLTDLVSRAFQQGLEIDSVQLSQTEALGANTPEQLEVMESHI